MTKTITIRSNIEGNLIYSLVTTILLIIVCEKPMGFTPMVYNDAGRHFECIFSSKLDRFGRNVANGTRDVYRGGSGRNLSPVWLKGGEFHPQGGRFPPDIWVILMIVL